MRIIAGKNKAKRLISPKTNKIRPTLDRVKEPLFSILMPYIQNANVLDLFAGTGALGIEAISRGATFAWFNDINKEATYLISSNLTLTGAQNCAKITRKEYDKCLIFISWLSNSSLLPSFSTSKLKKSFILEIVAFI